MKQIAHVLRKRSDRFLYRYDRLIRNLRGAEPGRRIVFLHIPKCAGTSVNAIFKGTIGSGRSSNTVLIDDRVDGPEVLRRIEKARTAQFVGGHFGFETLEAIRGEALAFTVLRDPFERIRSTYGHFHTRKQGNPLAHKVPGMTLEEYLTSEDPEILQWTDNVIARQLCARHGRDSVRDIDTSTMVTLAKANLDRLDRFVFLDSLASEMTKIAQAAGIRFDGKMPQENVTSQRASRDSRAAVAPLDDRLMELARPRILADLEVYEHAVARRPAPRTE